MIKIKNNYKKTKMIYIYLMKTIKCNIIISNKEMLN